ncbi:MAG: dihydrodipicolinate synthase family protein [Verrucomicrobiae bacterium]|nr:dihydrodipicolinate synthase family protein [Verrucomicrobiae bacterium]
MFPAGPLASDSRLREQLARGLVIPAMPLVLNANRKWSFRHQRALVRYYLDAGAGGLAVGVHTTQFEIRDPKHGLYEPVLAACAETARGQVPKQHPVVLVAGVCGTTAQAIREAETARRLGYDAVLVTLSAMREADDHTLLNHCREIGRILPLFGFYLQAAIGGRTYGRDFWRGFAELEAAVAIKIAPFDRYATLEVLRAVVESGRTDLALYTGNDDAILQDLLTPFPWGEPPCRIVGGLLGQWAVGTRAAVALLDDIKRGEKTAIEWARLQARLTDFNAALFDPAHRFAGCIAGIQEWLRRQGLIPSRACLNPKEDLSPGQAKEIDRVMKDYPEWQDTAFIAENRDAWLSD